MCQSRTWPLEPCRNSRSLSQIQLGTGGTRTYQFGPAGHLERTATGADSTLFLNDPTGRLSALERPSTQSGATFRYDGRDYLSLADSEALSFRDGFESADVCAWSGAIGLLSVPDCAIRPAVRSVYSSEGLLHSLHRNVAPQSSYVFHFAGRPVAQLDVAGGTESWRWLTTDHLGTPIAATSTDGAMLWQGGFEPFGADWSGAGGAGVFLRFPGQWGEGAWGASGEGLYYNVHRWYGWGTGRYTRPDPLFFNILGRAYSYVLQNPLAYLDRNGKAAELHNPSMQGLELPIFLGKCVTAPVLAAAHRWITAGAGPRWAHCFASCELAKCGGKILAENAALSKERFDLAICANLPRTGWLRVIQQKHCRSAFQPSDFEDNQTGRDCPTNTTCEKQCAPLFGEKDPPGGMFAGYGD